MVCGGAGGIERGSDDGGFMRMYGGRKSGPCN